MHNVDGITGFAIPPPPTNRNQLEASVSDKLVELQLKRSD